MGKLTLALLYLFVASIILGQLGRIPLPGGQEGALYVSDIVVVLLVTTWFIWKTLGVRSLKITPIDVSLSLFLAFGLLSLALSTTWLGTTALVVSFSYWIRFLFYALVVKVAADIFTTYKKNLSTFLIAAITFFAILGLIQFVVFPDFSAYVQHGWDPHYYRVLSTFFDPNFAGLLLSFGFIYLLHLLRVNKSIPLWIGILMLGLIGVALILTFSRSTYLAFGIGLTIYSLLSDKRIFVGMMVVATIAFLTIPRVQTRVIGALTLDETSRQRLSSYEDTLSVIQDHPLLGTGFNAYRYTQDMYGYFRDSRGVNQLGGHAGAGSDNSFLFAWVTAGIGGLVSIFMFLILVVVSVWKTPFRAAGVGLTAAYFIHAQFVNSLFFTALLAFFLIIIGTHLPHQEKNEPKPTTIHH